MHASESQHWYTRRGEPAYTVKAKDGSNRPATLRDARKLALVPSVTTIIRAAAAPGLEMWKARQVLLAALTLPKIDGEKDDEYCARIMQDSQEQGRKAAERGTAIHAAIQGHYEGEPPAMDYWPHVQGAAKAVKEWIDGDWKAERTFACDLGFGGKVDLSCRTAVLDFKTKEFDTTAELKTWDEHCMQLGAYRHGLGLTSARCAIVYVSSTVPGLAVVKELEEKDIQRGWTMFYSLLHFWKAKSTFDSGWMKEAA